MTEQPTKKTTQAAQEVTPVETKDVKETAPVEAKKVAKEPVQAKVKLTPGRLVSRADFVLRVEHNGQSLFIQPFGSAKVIKENLKIGTDVAKYLTFVKA